MYSGLSCKKQYLLQVTDKTLQMFGDTRIKAACNRTGCIFAVRNRVLTRKLRGIQAMRFCIFEIQGPSEVEVDKCNKLIENYFAGYKLRRPYSEKDAAVRLRIGSCTPDNTNLYFMQQRYGLGRSPVGDLQITSAAADTGFDTGNSLATLFENSDWARKRCRDFATDGASTSRRSASHAPTRPRVSFDDSVASTGAGASSDGDTRRFSVSFSEKEAAIKTELSRLQNFLSNLQLV